MSFRNRLFRFYESAVFPRIKHIRGTYRLKQLLLDWAITGIPKIEDSQVEDIFEAGNWDNLLILDACRHDLMEETLGKTVESRVTVASKSKEFVQKTFTEGDYSDTIVITANPHYYSDLFEKITGRKPEETFHSVYHTYQTDWEDNTVLPEKVIRDFETADKLFPEKRKIVHFMQPHNPFIGAELEANVDGFSKFMGVKEGNGEHVTEWDLAREGKLSDEEVWEAYKATLELVLDEIRSNRDKFSGRTIITADHGNFAGEKGFYDHPGGRKEIPLRKVPWINIEEI